MSTTTSFQYTAFLNLPVTDLARSIAFYTGLGFIQNHAFSDQNAAMMSLPPSPSTTSGPRSHEGAFKLMLLNHSFYSTFLPQGLQIADATKVSQQILCIALPSKEAVDKFLEKVVEGGGKRDVRDLSEMDKVMQEKGFYGGNATDLDGHLVECCYMPPEMYVGKE